MADNNGKSLASDTLSGICNIWLVKLWERERQRPPQGAVHAIGMSAIVTAIGENNYSAAQILTRGNLCSRLLFHIAQEPIYASLEGKTHLGYNSI